MARANLAVWIRRDTSILVHCPVRGTAYKLGKHVAAGVVFVMTVGYFWHIHTNKSCVEVMGQPQTISDI